MADVRRIAASPHATGTAENAAVRAYVIERLRGLGLEVREARAPLPRRAVDAADTIQNHPCLGKTRQAHQINHDVIAAIMSGNQPRQHAGIGGRWSGVDQRQPRAGQWVHRPHPRHQRMRMTAAHQNHIPDHRIIAVHPAP